MKISAKDIKLASMMFIEYAMFSIWWIQMASYLDTIGIAGNMKSGILSSIAIGCMFSSIVGMFADRFFKSEKVLATLYTLFGVLLILSAYLKDESLIFISVTAAMICYIPTWALSNAIVMAHTKNFPAIRMFGSIGWGFASFFSLTAVNFLGVEKFDGTNLPLIYGGGLAFLGAVIALILPTTNPQGLGKKFSIIDALGLRAFTLMKDRNFAALIICSFLVMIPFSLYWSYLSTFLKAKGFTYLTLTSCLSQVSQITVIPLLPFMIKKWGIRGILISGLVAMFLRYVSFYSESLTDIDFFIYLAIAIHGAVYVNFFIASQVYVNNNAPAHMRAEAQGLIFLIQFGLGLFVGTFINGKLLSYFFDPAQNIYNWGGIWSVTWLTCLLILAIFIISFKPLKEK